MSVQTINYVAAAINDSYRYIEATVSKQISRVIYLFEAAKSLRLVIGIIVVVSSCRFVANLQFATIIAFNNAQILNIFRVALSISRVDLHVICLPFSDQSRETMHELPNRIADSNNVKA